MSSTSSTSSSALHPLLVPLQKRLASLEAQVAASGQSNQLSPATHKASEKIPSGPQFVLVLLGSSQLGGFSGWEGGRVAAKTIANLVESNVSDISFSANIKVLAYVIHDVSTGPRASALELAQGFTDICPQGSFLFVSAPEYAHTKVSALLKLHGAMSNCVRIIASGAFKPVVDGAANSLLQKTFYLAEDQLAPSEEGYVPADDDEEEGEDEQEEDADESYESSTVVETYSPPFKKNWKQVSKAPEMSSGTRRIDHSLALHLQEPRICTQHVLAGPCRHPNCSYCHDYSLTPSETEQLRQKIKSIPCNSVKKDAAPPCANSDEECIYGHSCPDGARCTRRNCFFKARSAHPPSWSPPSFPFGNHLNVGFASRGGRGGTRAAAMAAIGPGRKFSGKYNAVASGAGRGQANKVQEEELGEVNWADESRDEEADDVVW